MIKNYVERDTTEHRKTRHELLNNGQTLKIKNVVLIRDLPMNFFYIPYQIFKDSVGKWEFARVLAPRHPSYFYSSNTYGYLKDVRINTKKRAIISDIIISTVVKSSVISIGVINVIV